MIYVNAVITIPTRCWHALVATGALGYFVSNAVRKYLSKYRTNKAFVCIPAHVGVSAFVDVPLMLPASLVLLEFVLELMCYFRH